MSDKDYSAIKAQNVAKAVETDKEVVIKQKPLVTGAKAKKKGLMERLVNVTIGPDGFKRIGTYVTHEVVGPMVRDMLASGAKTVIDMLLYRDGAPRNNYSSGYSSGYSRTPSYNNNRTSYNSAYSNVRTPKIHSPVERLMDVQYIEIPSKSEADDIIDYLQGEINQHDQVLIADYYSCFNDDNITTTYLDQTYGWFDLSTARSKPTRNGGWYIEFPPAEQVRL